MADLSANFQSPNPTAHRGGPRTNLLAERANRYEQAMQKSMASRRRLGTSYVRHPNLQQSEIPEEERASDGGVQSQLGDSYVEDVRTRNGMLIDRGKPFNEQSQTEQDEELANGGFVGLLAQIYDQRRQVL
jgi:autophagy-related protein 9